LFVVALCLFFLNLPWSNLLRGWIRSFEQLSRKLEQIGKEVGVGNNLECFPGGNIWSVVFFVTIIFLYCSDVKL